MLLDDALRGVSLVAAETGPIVDVGSGGGTPGIPLAASLPDRAVTLLEAERRKCEFLERWPAELPNLRVVWGRAEEQPLETYGVAVAKALAQPVTAVEWCLPLVREGGAVLLWVGPSVELERVERAAALLAGRREDAPDGLPTPPQGRPDAAGLSAPHRRRPQATARLTELVTRSVARVGHVDPEDAVGEASARLDAAARRDPPRGIPSSRPRLRAHAARAPR